MSREEDRGLGKRVVLTTLGSLGDLHPFLALARGLQERGHEPLLATSEVHRGRVERAGVGFRPIRPTMLELENDPEAFRRGMDPREGPSYVIRELFMAHVRDGFEDLRASVEGADLMVAHSIVFAAPIVAEVTGVPWATLAIAPMVFMSKYDPPVVPLAPALRHLRFLGPRFWGPLLAIGRWSIRSWSDPVRSLRSELGLLPGRDPIFEAAYSPDRVLAIFPELFGAPQPDWPAQTVQSGFLHYDRTDGKGLEPLLKDFLDAGEPPVVFTLGSSAVMTAGTFFQESLKAVQRLGRRAVLLIGRDERNRLTAEWPVGIFVADYAPYSELFPKSAAVVHQGGVGTTAHGLRAGVPTLVVPWSHDQFDNADRVVRLGTGLTLGRKSYNARTAARVLENLLGNPSIAERAGEVGRKLRSGDGLAAACDALDDLMAARPVAETSGG